MGSASLAKTLLSWTAALVLCLVTWEIIARNFIFIGLQPRLLPDGSQYYVGKSVKSQEGYSRFEFSEDGYRLPLPPKDVEPRVLVIGDSFTQSAQVSDEETYVVQTQKNLDSMGVTAALWNAGSAGLSPPAYIGVATHFRETLKPSWAVVQLNTIDFRNDRKDKSRVYWAEPEGDSFVLKHNAKNATGVLGPKALRKIPGALAALKTATQFSLGQTFVEKLTAKPDEQAHGGPKSRPDPAEVQKEEETVAAYVRWSVQELKKAYGNLVILYVPTINYFDLKEAPPKDETTLEAVCREEGVPLVNPRSAYLEEFKETGRPSHGFSNTTPGVGHLNSTGNRLLGQELAKALGSVLDRP